MVFAVGFGAGYGLMSLAVGEPASAEPQAVDKQAEPAAPAAAVEATAAEPAPAEPEVAAVAEPAVAAAVEVPPPVDTPAEPAVAEPAAEAPGAVDAPGAEGEPAVAEPAEPGESAEVGTAEPAEPSWWDACVGKVCAVDFGAITGGLLVRKGTVEHGATIDWGRDFAGKPRIDVLPTEANVKVKVRGVALDADGVPAAAEVLWRNGDATVEGVISLNLGEADKRVRFIPPTAP
ncbi:MAG: hypothetical protein H6744_04280 [Deltaproteobacteria bacterium]|nr:hypothetical protein [Deltaproteobacteria bacterium]MCB9785896.1 hypothetical protein [Deltaproteobacteria bacterium]